MISHRSLLALPLLLIAGLAALPHHAAAQDVSIRLAPSTVAQGTLSTTTPPHLQLEAPDMRAVDRALTRGKRFRRAGAVLAGVGGVLVIGGLVGVATYEEPDSCIICGPLGAYATMGIGGFVLSQALITYLIGRGIEARHRSAWRASIDRHGGSVRLDLQF